MPITDNLVAHWKLDEASGSRADSIGANTLTDNNTVTSAAGKLGNAASFAAVNSEYLSIADNDALSMGDIDITIACWMKATTLNDHAPLIWKGDYDLITTVEYGVWYDINVERFRFKISDGFFQTGVATADNVGKPSTGTWYYVVGWHDATANTVNIQVNNATAESTSYSSGGYDGLFAMEIGRQYSSFTPVYFDGLIDSVSIWKRVLTAGERTSLYNSGAGLEYPFVLSGGAYRLTGGLIRGGQLTGGKLVG